MLQFGSISTGGSGSTDLWQLNGVAPNSISVKTPTVTGIDSPNFTNPLIKLFSGLYKALFPITGQIYKNGTRNLLNVIGTFGPNHLALLGFGNDFDNSSASIQVNDIGQAQIHADDGASYSSNYQQDFNSISIRVTNPVDTAVEKNVNINAENTRIIVLGVDVLNYGADANGFIVTDGVNQRFRITPTGNIQTDQSQALPVKLPNGNYIEIFDLAGASLGFIQLTA